MIVTGILVVLVAVALLLLARAARGQGAAGIVTVVDLQGRTTAIDIAAFRNLISPQEEDYLRHNLPPSEFRRIQKERMRAAAAYIHQALQNAAVLLRLGEAAQRSADPQLAAAGSTLVDTAIRLRLYAFFVLLKLYLNIAFPGLQLSSLAVVDRYERLTDAMAHFTRLQQPGLVTRISLSL
ncbi:MAG TPA: hypothetical protein VJQ50_02730 [Terriglobales bacterium]|nr:hypothetical protein [Terriglobales bacterium]